MLPPFRFRFSRKGEEKPSIRKLDVANVLLSFVSVNTNTSTWFEIRYFNYSNFLDMKLMFRFPKTTLFGSFSLIFLSSHI